MAWLTKFSGILRPAAAVCVAAVLFGAQPASEIGDAPKPYIRKAENADGDLALEVALRAFRPAAGTGSTVWLAGVTHLGSTNYYTALQTFLNTQALVLFEGVGASDKRFASSQEDDYSLQSALAKALGLAFQIDQIDYSPSHWRNSDLSAAQIAGLLSTHGPTHPSDDQPGGSDGAPEFQYLMDVMQGTGFLGRLARAAIGFIGANPRFQATTKVAMIELLGDLPEDLSRIGGIPAGMQRLMRVLIEERNKRVVRDVQSALASADRPRSVAVLYGAGHMIDLERRMQASLGYVATEERWLRAFGVSPKKVGLSEWELRLTRYWIQRQLELLKAEDPHDEDDKPVEEVSANR